MTIFDLEQQLLALSINSSKVADNHIENNAGAAGARGKFTAAAPKPEVKYLDEQTILAKLPPFSGNPRNGSAFISMFLL